MLLPSVQYKPKNPLKFRHQGHSEMSVGTSGKDLLDTVVTQQDSDEKGDAATVTKEDFTLHL